MPFLGLLFLSLFCACEKETYKLSFYDKQKVDTMYRATVKRIQDSIDSTCTIKQARLEEMYFDSLLQIRILELKK